MVEQERRELYDRLSQVLTDYEEELIGADELYRMLCEIQNNWETVITVQE